MLFQVHGDNKQKPEYNEQQHNHCGITEMFLSFCRAVAHQSMSNRLVSYAI